MVAGWKFCRLLAIWLETPHVLLNQQNIAVTTNETEVLTMGAFSLKGLSISLSALVTEINAKHN